MPQRPGERAGQTGIVACMEDTDRVEVDLVGVRVELPSNNPIVLLRERDGDRFLPIWIGPVEAQAIAFALQGIVTQRPMTHDLMKDVIEGLGARLERVDVTDLQDTTFFAELHITGVDTKVVSSRPSDAIALAVRMRARIFVAPSVLDSAGILIRDEDEEREVQKFREFIDQISPEDFGASGSGSSGGSSGP
jgi:bifunctional DNase/RNase